jgi:hypothetical protein
VRQGHAVRIEGDDDAHQGSHGHCNLG